MVQSLYDVFDIYIDGWQMGGNATAEQETFYIIRIIPLDIIRIML